MVTVLDSFEDGDISEYSGDTGIFSVIQSPVYDGSNALEGADSGTRSIISRVDKGIAPEETPFGVFARPSEVTGGGFTDATSTGMVWANQTATSQSSLDAYAVNIVQTNGSIEFIRFEDGTATQIANISANVDPQTWYEIRVTEWTEGGDITVELRLASDDSLVKTLSTTDNTYGAGGFGFICTQTGGFDGTNPSHADYAYKTESINAPPNVQITDSSTEDELTLDWNEVANATSYNVYRAQSSGSSTSDYTLVAQPTSPPYTDTALEDGEKYYYRVTSEN